jgi:hypothetical protein
MPQRQSYPRRHAAARRALAALSCLLGALLLLSATANASASAARSHPAGAAVPSAPLILHAIGGTGAARQTNPFGAQPLSPSGGGAGPQPLSPFQIRRAYGLPRYGAHNQTVAIISAFDDPTAQSDLAAYDRYFGLPACSESNGCLKIFNQEGQSSPLPGPDVTEGDWITESAIGTELVHSLCESCRIDLFEADFDDTGDFVQAIQSAGALGASVVVTTFAPSEFDSEAKYETYFNSKRTAYVAASGDLGYGSANFPAALPDVLAVGGTTLTLRDGGYGSESVWNLTSSGCSQYITAPPWQQRILGVSGCGSYRADNDISAMADPGTIIYASGIQGTRGGALYQAEGTSVSAPLIGAVIGLAGSDGAGEAAMLYARRLSDPAGLHEVTTGNNAPGCRTAICRGRAGWNGPTGLGTPEGLADFLPRGPVLSPEHPTITLSVPRGGMRFSRAWIANFRLVNGNPFTVGGRVTLFAWEPVGGGRRRLEPVATNTFSRGSLQGGPVRLKLALCARSILQRNRRLEGFLSARVAGHSGRAVIVRRALTILGP